MPKKKSKKTTSGKVKYEIDPHNRLVISGFGRRGELPRFRQVLTGRFKVNKDNSLTYLIRAPVAKRFNIPHQVKLRGNWSLSDSHNLRFTLTKWGRQTLGDQLTLQGTILDVNKNFLLFAVTTRIKENAQSMYVLKLQGVWQADKNNRLTFGIKREKGRYDIFIFHGAWEINKHHQIIYQYKKAQLIRKQKKIHTLIFKGYWDIKNKTRISYVIDRASDSAFSFKTALGIFKDNYIKYEVGIGIAGRAKPIKRTVTLFGTWKIKKNIGLTFEIEYEDKKIHVITFGAKAKLTSKDTIFFKLRNERNKDLGGEIELSRKILEGDGEAFLRFLKSKRESVILFGLGFRW